MQDKRRAICAVVGLGVTAFLMLVPHSVGRVLPNGGIGAPRPQMPQALSAPQDSALLPSTSGEAAALAMPDVTRPNAETSASHRLDVTGLREAIAAYKTGNLAAGDEQTKRIVDPLAAT